MTEIAGHICKFFYNYMIFKEKRRDIVAGRNILYEAYSSSDDNTTIMNLSFI